MSRYARFIPHVLAAVMLTLSGAMPLRAAEPGVAAASGSQYTVLAGHIGAADNQVRRGTCFELRGEPGPDLVGTGSGGAGRWSVQHGFWAGTVAARSDTVFFHRFEVCHP